MRLIDAEKLNIIIGAHMLNENITLEEALKFKAIVKDTPTIKHEDVSLYMGDGMWFRFTGIGADFTKRYGNAIPDREMIGGDTE